MRKLIFISLAIFLACGAVFAAPSKRLPVKITQSDGSVVTLTKEGDEHCHFFSTADGLAVYENENGDYCYLGAEGKTSMLAHEPLMRSAAETAFIATLGDKPIAASVRKMNKAAKKSEKKNGGAVICHGTPNVPVVLIQYKDKKLLGDPLENFEEFLHGQNGCKKYFTDNSLGDFIPQFDMLGPVTLSEGYAYYGANDSHGDDARAGIMVKETCDSLFYRQNVDFSKYDNNGDGFVDVVFIIYAGKGENGDGDSRTIWPHQWSFTENEVGAPVQYGNVKVDLYGCTNEVSGTRVEGIGTFCHEFSHCIGLFDFYDVYGSNYGLGAWSVMDRGCYLNNSDNPCAYTAHEREYLNWIQVDTIGGYKENLTLTDIDDGGKAYKVVNPLNHDEYYIIECRNREGWDNYIPGTSGGVQVMHIDYDQEAWEQNRVNTSKVRCCLIPADNSRSSYSESGDLYPYNGNNEVSYDSAPAAKVNIGDFMDQNITSISYENNQATITFESFVNPRLDEPSEDDIAPNSLIAHWAEMPGIDSYTLKVTDITNNEPTAVIEEDFANFVSKTIDIGGSLDQYMTNPGWSGYNVIGKTKGAALGTASKYGYLNTPELDITAGNYVVTAAFEAAPLTGDSDVRLIASVNGNRPSRQIFNLNDKKWRYATFFCEDGNSPVKLRFEAAAAAQRPLFSGIKIYVGTAGETVCHENLSGPSFEVTGLEPEHTYYLQLKAECNNGYESQYSNGILVTLPKDGPGAAPMIGGDESSETAVYSITGVQIPANALTPGIYIMKSGSKTSKFVVK